MAPIDREHNGLIAPLPVPSGLYPGLRVAPQLQNSYKRKSQFLPLMAQLELDCDIALDFAVPRFS